MLGKFCDMKVILTSCILIAISAHGQTKKETEDWLTYYLNKYFSSDMSVMSRDGTINSYDYTTKEFTFKGKNMLCLSGTFRRSPSKKDSLINLVEETINLSKIIKVTQGSSSIEFPPFSSYISFDFSDVDFNTPSVSTFNRTKNQYEAKGYRLNYVMDCYDDEVLKEKIINRMAKAFEYLATLAGAKVIKDVF
jgi:hypothetical protein